MALAPCLLGYGAIAKHLYASPTSKTGDDNLYWSWIANYVADDYATAVKTGCELLERHAVLQSPGRIEELVGVFVHATKVSDSWVVLSMLHWNLKQMLTRWLVGLDGDWILGDVPL